MPPLLLPFCIFAASLAALPIGAEAFAPLATSGRGFAVGSLPLRRRMRHDDDDEAHHRPSPPSLSKNLLSLLSSSGNINMDDEDGGPKLSVKNEIAILESSFLHMSDNYNNGILYQLQSQYSFQTWPCVHTSTHREFTLGKGGDAIDGRAKKE